MSILLQKEISINRILTIDVAHAKALDDPARIKILQVLYHRDLSTVQIAEELHKAGYKKATTTIRHHLDVLKQAGLVEIVKMKEIRGAVLKFYGTSFKLFGFKSPSNFDSIYSKAINDTSIKMEKVIKNIVQKSNAKTRKKTIEKNDFLDQNYDEYILMEIVNRAVAKVFESKSAESIEK